MRRTYDPTPSYLSNPFSLYSAQGFLCFTEKAADSGPCAPCWECFSPDLPLDCFLTSSGLDQGGAEGTERKNSQNESQVPATGWLEGPLLGRGAGGWGSDVGKKMPSSPLTWELNNTCGPFRVRHQDAAQQIHDLEFKVEIRLGKPFLGPHGCCGECSNPPAPGELDLGITNTLEFPAGRRARPLAAKSAAELM